MALNFPNRSRSYDATRRAVRFWGHDGPMEAAFFVSAEQIDPCCDRLDRRQIDMVPGPREFLACLCERGTARAALGLR
jgi:Protein of unknown function (DUF1488)